MPPTRAPKGYVGTGHETIGSDVLSILRVIMLPELMLGQQLAGSLKTIEPDQWYPMSVLYDPVEILHKKLGDASLIRVGSELFRITHAANVKKQVTSAKQLIYGLDTLYHLANRGTDIGGWSVLSFEPGKAVVEKTTPYHCVLEQGILMEALFTIGIPVTIEQRKCFRKGADCCEYVISSVVKDARWTG